jgi:hypothetical protein
MIIPHETQSVEPRAGRVPTGPGISGGPGPGPDASDGVTGGRRLLRDLFRAERGPILLTYAVLNLEYLLGLVQLWVIGWAVNGLARASYRGLALFVAQHLAHLAVGTFRRRYDTRTFTRIYADLASRLVAEQRRRGLDTSRVAARSVLSREFVDFFETSIPLAIQTCYSVLGSLALLALYRDGLLVLGCLALVAPAALLNAAYGRRTLRLSAALHDELEREVDALERGEPAEVRGHYGRLARWRVALSDAEAGNFARMELFVLALLAVALVRSCRVPGTGPGDVLALLGYVLMFVSGLDGVPGLVQQASRLNDLGRRLGGGVGEDGRAAPRTADLIPGRHE